MNNHPHFERAKALLIGRKVISAGRLRAEFDCTWTEACRLIDELHMACLIGPYSPDGQRKVLTENLNDPNR